jgi:chromosome segregation ATPase
MARICALMLLATLCQAAELTDLEKAKIEAQQALSKAEASLLQTRRAEAEMRKTFQKDRDRLADLTSEAEQLSQRLRRLEERTAMAKSDLETDEESLGKITRARESWEETVERQQKDLRQADLAVKEAQQAEADARRRASSVQSESAR